MYQFSYSEMLDDTPGEARALEHRALLRSIALLKSAEAAGLDAPETAEAIGFLLRLWAIFLEDLAAPSNGLAPPLRADLISIGLWLMKEAEEVRFGRSQNLRGLIEVSQSIADGLK
ncbi:MAG: flagellar biosynthesis regulator FlaF [Hyphomicrobiales bacterium]|nr:flagellar biosynthesis regulator FlaF [Hyphomicrobiales bacterium]